jgi:hypothetical protein
MLIHALNFDILIYACRHACFGARRWFVMVSSPADMEAIAKENKISIFVG